MSEELNNEEEVFEQPAVIEKVSLKEIEDEKTQEEFEEINDFAREFLKLSPEEKEVFKDMLLHGDDDEGE